MRSPRTGVATVGYREQRGERNWMRSSCNPRRAGGREEAAAAAAVAAAAAAAGNGDFHIRTFRPFLALPRARGILEFLARLRRSNTARCGCVSLCRNTYVKRGRYAAA